MNEDYLQRFFGHCIGAAEMRAEGSVTYLYTPERMEPILRLWPDAKFIIALRDPLAMLPSLHSRLLVTGDEKITDFARAWDKIGQRARGRSIPRSTIDPRFLRYDEAGMLGSRVEQFFEVVGQGTLPCGAVRRPRRRPGSDLPSHVRFPRHRDLAPRSSLKAQAVTQDVSLRLASTVAQAAAQGSPHRPCWREIPPARKEARRAGGPDDRSHLQGPQAAARLEQGPRQAATARSPGAAARLSTGCATKSSSCPGSSTATLATGSAAFPKPSLQKRKRCGPRPATAATRPHSCRSDSPWRSHGHRPPSSCRAPSARIRA